MNNNFIKYIRYAASAIILIFLMINIYYVSPGQNKLAEPWDLIFSVLTPLVLLAASALLLPLKDNFNSKNLKYFAAVLVMALTVYGNQYLSRNYWYKLSSFWSFVLSVLIPTVILFSIVFWLYKNKGELNATKPKT